MTDLTPAAQAAIDSIGPWMPVELPEATTFLRTHIERIQAEARATAVREVLLELEESLNREYAAQADNPLPYYASGIGYAMLAIRKRLADLSEPLPPVIEADMQARPEVYTTAALLDEIGSLRATIKNMTADLTPAAEITDAVLYQLLVAHDVDPTIAESAVRAFWGRIQAEARASAEAEWLTVERLDAALGKVWGHILRMTDYNESRAEVAAAILAALAAPPAEPRE